MEENIGGFGGSVGFIRSEFEIKVLILYVLNRLPSPIDGEELAGLVMIDGGFGYFDYKTHLWGLTETGHVSEEDYCFAITDKGREVLEILQDLIAISVRRKANKITAPVAERMRKTAVVKTEVNYSGEDSIYDVKLSLSDGNKNSLLIQMNFPNEKTALRAEENFKKKGKDIYSSLMNELLKD